MLVNSTEEMGCLSRQGNEAQMTRKETRGYSDILPVLAAHVSICNKTIGSE